MSPPWGAPGPAEGGQGCQAAAAAIVWGAEHGPWGWPGLALALGCTGTSPRFSQIVVLWACSQIMSHSDTCHHGVICHTAVTNKVFVWKLLWGEAWREMLGGNCSDPWWWNRTSDTSDTFTNFSAGLQEGFFLFPALQWLYRVTAKALVFRLDMLRDVDGPEEPQMSAIKCILWQKENISFVCDTDHSEAW